MLGLFQLLLAVFAIYGALEFSEELRLVGPLGCLVAMFVVSRVEKRKLEKESSRKNYLQSEMDKVSKKESMAI